MFMAIMARRPSSSKSPVVELLYDLKHAALENMAWGDTFIQEMF